jgi:hypothetical protein
MSPQKQQFDWLLFQPYKPYLQNHQKHFAHGFACGVHNHPFFYKNENLTWESANWIER